MHKDIIGAFLGFLLFSCSYGLEELPSSRATSRGDGFDVAEARSYFEENATDLSYESVRLTSAVKTGSGTYEFNEEGGRMSVLPGRDDCYRLSELREEAGRRGALRLLAKVPGLRS